jgi:hypothetical protein
MRTCVRIDLDRTLGPLPAEPRTQAFTLWFASSTFTTHASAAAELIQEVLEVNPFTTLQVVLEPRGEPAHLSIRVLHKLMMSCQRRPTYMDRYFALQPGRPIGAKRLVVVLPDSERQSVAAEWLDEVDAIASIVWPAEPQVPRRVEKERLVLA